jgi:hypothetical protein
VSVANPSPNGRYSRAAIVGCISPLISLLLFYLMLAVEIHWLEDWLWVPAILYLSEVMCLRAWDGSRSVVRKGLCEELYL